MDTPANNIGNKPQMPPPPIPRQGGAPPAPPFGAPPISPPPPPIIMRPPAGAPPPPPILTPPAAPAPQPAPAPRIAPAPQPAPTPRIAPAPQSAPMSTPRSAPPVQPSSQRAPGSERVRSSGSIRISKVPSVPVLFDNEPLSYDDEPTDRQEKNLPDIMFEPLHVLDPLCIKWKLHKLSAPVHVPEIEEEDESDTPPPTPVSISSRAAHISAPVSSRAIIAPIPTSSRLVQGYVRLMGLLSNGTPWDCSIPIADMAGQRGISIGRDGSICNIALAEASISRKHVLFELTDGGTVVITDQASTNGTFLNGRRLTPGEERVPLEDGSILALGDITLRVEILSPSESSYVPL